MAHQVARPVFMDQFSVFGQGIGGGEIGGQFLVFDFDQVESLLRGSGIHRRHGGHRLAAITHLVAGQRVFVHGDGQHTEGLVAGVAGDHRGNAGQRLGL